MPWDLSSSCSPCSQDKVEEHCRKVETATSCNPEEVVHGKVCWTGMFGFVRQYVWRTLFRSAPSRDNESRLACTSVQLLGPILHMVQLPFSEVSV